MSDEQAIDTLPDGAEDLTGRRFGRLSVLRYDGINANHMTRWACECDCGRTKTVLRSALVNGTTWRCGRNCPLDTGMVPGATFGALMLVRKLNDSATQEGELWLCECECGNSVEVTTRELRRGRVTSCGCGASKHRRARQANGAVNQTRLSRLGSAPDRDSSTGVRGVSYYSDADRFVAEIIFRRHRYLLGRYRRIDDARRAREEAERRIFGPTLRSSGLEYPDHAECLRIVADIRRRHMHEAGID